MHYLICAHGTSQLTEPQQNNRPKIAFIDDEIEILDGIRRVLTAQHVDWEMLFFSAPLTALHDKRLLSCDVVVSDLKMPGMNGLELMKALRHKGFSAEIIILTGTGDMEAAMEAINEIKAFRFYVKPCPQQRLLNGITEAIVKRRTSIGATDLLPFAVIALDLDKQITFMNKEGAEMISAADVIMQDGKGRCLAATSTGTESLYTAIEAMNESGDPVVLGINGGKTGSRFSILIERASDDKKNSSVYLFIMDPNKRKPPPPEALKNLFDLTNSEAKLAYGLALGQDLKEAAKSMDVTIQTARTYLKVLFDKTGTNRQADLVRTMIIAVPQVRGGN